MGVKIGGVARYRCVCVTHFKTRMCVKIKSVDMCAYARLGLLALIVKQVGVITWVVGGCGNGC